ncbi:glucokinase [Rhabdochromatium marinum]|uniref:glucokinase n=1 Tax=Rhabdochromatium marinum TaxID=48729 RepID=UPI001907D4CC|nr:glucokinase [Rhabdochromatium marinum]MBK1649101.1 glucokinase [Rhabdochromatium marinum]
MSVLVGDIGGTKTQVAIAQTTDGSVQLHHERRYASRDYAGLAAIVTDYLDGLASQGQVRPTAAALAIAGPVVADRCEATNLPWQLDARALESATGLDWVRLLNDLEAVAWGIPGLRPEQCLSLQAGQPDSQGHIAVVAPGTGLGQAGLFWDGQRHHPFATEGGHTDFAPTDAREFALLEFLQERFGRVSWERVVSGMGIETLYEFVLAYNEGTHHPRMEQTAGGDVAATVSALAAAGECGICQATMELFMRLLGREAGNTALKLMARGGLYLAGGILPKNLAVLQEGGFLQGFLDKGRMRGLLEAIPVQLVLEERIALIGAARALQAQAAR